MAGGSRLQDREAFAAVYVQHAEVLRHFILRRCGNAEVAIDLVSETFAKALERRHQFRGSTPEEERGWLLAIARSELLQHWRRNALHSAALTRLGVDAPPPQDPAIERVDELASLPRAAEVLAALPPEQRRAVELRVCADAAYEDVAETLGVTIETARTRVSRALRTLALEVEA
ncbi:RNA polymerase sigma factor [Solirubrobacter phytolaccae]|uniref:RNA polymerase sigma factor n=1 Tax=Solirubrobacter phytolaccae TaxID=1404360 RepID=A0A9X3SAB0_9ACTN|nr:RNA polymerase sigma factor [Solirubrobacter phytolaccae]MDA0183453.1 RNA polymerase sigma factor [Solirubrobacter phytolaccae]